MLHFMLFARTMIVYHSFLEVYLRFMCVCEDSQVKLNAWSISAYG
uniref:Uncharacterized protein n=1 Tax=Rhizophora mucronata TaxID=61149 RepID=A0A2P2QDS0_RHIMU